MTLTVGAVLAATCAAWITSSLGAEEEETAIIGSGYDFSYCEYSWCRPAHESLLEAGHALTEGVYAHRAEQALLAHGDHDLAMELRGRAVPKYAEAMSVLQRSMRIGNWHGCTWVERRTTMVETLTSIARDLERREWAALVAQRDPSSPQPAESLTHRLLREAPAVFGTSLRLGASLASFRAALDLPATIRASDYGFRRALRDRGVIARFQDDQLTGVDFLFRAESLAHYAGSNFNGHVWGVIGADTTRSDLIALLGWPSEVLVPENSAESAPYGLVYTLGGYRVSFVFQLGRYVTLSHVSFDLDFPGHDQGVSRVVLAPDGTSHWVWSAWQES